jgi:hypothetical protein
VLRVRQGCEFGGHKFYLHLLKRVQYIMSIIRGEQRSGDSEKSLKDWIHSSSAPSTYKEDDAHLANSSIAEDLCSAVFEYSRCFWYGVRGSDLVAKSGQRAMIKKNLEDFILWRHGFRDGRLDRALERSEPLKIEVLTILYNMAKLLLQGKPTFFYYMQRSVWSVWL